MAAGAPVAPLAGVWPGNGAAYRAAENVRKHRLAIQRGVKGVSRCAAEEALREAKRQESLGCGAEMGQGNPILPTQLSGVVSDFQAGRAQGAVTA